MTVTFTRPAPDSPVTSMFAISSCSFCIRSCICWACFIRLPIPPLPNIFISLVIVECFT
ncbi:Uncharacterised protein [Vibrio cholerae]|nr:Uncharacterised protein [Vibrio cholerae]